MYIPFVCAICVSSVRETQALFKNKNNSVTLFQIPVDPQQIELVDFESITVDLDIEIMYTKHRGSGFALGSLAFKTLLIGEIILTTTTMPIMTTVHLMMMPRRAETHSK